MSEKKLEDMNFENIFIDMTGRQFTLKKKNEDDEIPLLCRLIVAKAREGETLGMILLDCGIKHSSWVPLIKKNKKIQKAVSDGIAFRRAYGERQLLEMATGKQQHSSTLAKLYMKEFYDISGVYDPEEEIDGGSSGSYQVITVMPKKKKKNEKN